MDKIPLSVIESEIKCKTSKDQGITDVERAEDSSEYRDTDDDPNRLIYTVTETPPWYECILLGFQHYLTMFIGSLAIPYILADNICAEGDPVVRSELTGVMFFVCGIITIVQVTLGVRLPIVQCSTMALLSPTLSYLTLPAHSCPLIQGNCTDIATANLSCVERGSEEYTELWQSRIQVIQGSIMVGSLVEIALGITGLIGFMVRYIGPLSICPTISLLGMSLFRSAADYSSKNWWICLMTLVFLCLFSQYIGLFAVPLPKFNKKDGCHTVKYPLFKMFPVILAVLLAWFICFILTVTNAIPDDSNHWAYGGRTDLNSDLIKEAPWFTFFWPGKYGAPSADISLIIGLLGGFMASIVESIGDYYACSRMAGAPPPPKYAVNRGIFTEGIGCFLTGAFGTGNGSTSISQNIGVIGLTRIGSRVVIIYTGFIMILLAIFSKFAALFMTIPDPIIGASFIVLFGMIVAVGMSNLQYVDMNSSRNLFVFGFSFFMGLTISEWIIANPSAINTGWEPADNIFTVLLGTSMFVGGFLGFVLDNSIPGSKKERGLLHMQHGSDMQEDEENIKQIYSIPFIGTWLDKFAIVNYIPICPGKSTEMHSKL